MYWSINININSNITSLTFTKLSEVRRVWGTYTTRFTTLYVLILHNRRCFQHAHFIPIVGVGKRGAY